MVAAGLRPEGPGAGLPPERVANERVAGVVPPRTVSEECTCLI